MEPLYIRNNILNVLNVFLLCTLKIGQTQTVIRPLSVQSKKNRQIKAGAVDLHFGYFHIRKNTRWQMMKRILFVFEATEATLQCHYNTLQMSWKIKRGQHQQNHCICVRSRACVPALASCTVSPVTLYHNVNNWRYYTVSCNWRSVGAVVFMLLRCLTHFGARGPDVCFGKQNLNR